MGRQLRLTAVQQSECESLIPFARALAARHYGTEEAESTALLALCEAVATYRQEEGASLRTYVKAAIKKAMADEQPTVPPAGLLWDAVDTAPAADAAAIADEILKGLPDDLAELCRAVWIEGLTVREAADRFCLSTASVSRRLNEARATLKRRMQR